MDNTNGPAKRPGTKTGPTLPSNVSIDDIVRAVDEDDNTGFCLACGAEAFSIEPDARRYRCEECEAKQVYGAQELLLMFVP